jgi:hypothetical protein
MAAIPFQEVNKGLVGVDKDSQEWFVGRVVDRLLIYG